MRFYKLKIDGRTFEELDSKNPMALRIEFDFREYDGETTPNKIITITNPPYDIFKNPSKLLNKRVELYAGFLDAPYFKRNKIRIPKQNLIGFGYIQNILNNWNLGADSNTNIILSPSPIKRSEDDDISKLGYLLQIKKGDSIKDKMEEGLKGIYPQSKIKLEDADIQAVEDETLIIYNSNDIKSLGARYKAKLYTSIDGFLIANEQKLGANVRVFQDVDFIEQPNIIGVDRMIATLMLRGDLALGVTMSIPASVFNTINPNTQFYTYQPKTFIGGEWDIIKIWHKGDSRNSDYKSWITSIEAVKKGVS